MARGDLNGQKINHWTILDDLGGGKVICQCDCESHTVRELYKKAVISGRSKSCGCDRVAKGIKVGDIFNEWEVIEKRPNRMVLCRCSCGAEKEVFEGSLKSGASKSCGHKKIKTKTQVKDIKKPEIEGRVFGDWLVVQKLNKDKALCKCTSCGKESEVYISNLKRGRSKSCGCQNDKYKKIARDNTFNSNYLHKNFGFLEVIGQGTKSGTALCKCVCGKIKEISIQGLNNGTSKSCGCKSNELHIQTMYARYGEVTHNKVDNPREDWQIQAVSSRDNLVTFISTFQSKPFVYELCEKLGIQEAQMLVIIHKFGAEEYINWDRNQSRYEKEIVDFIASIYNKDIIKHCRNVISPNELDIYLPDKKLAIEFDGDYWHSSYKLDKDYHLYKTIKCKEEGIRLIHIFEYEWVNNKSIIKDYIENLISNDKNIVYARQLDLVQVDCNDAYTFEDKFHLQGRAQSNINIGLAYHGELIGLMTFSKPRFDRNMQYELIRLCYKNGINVVGGSEKMFKYFLKLYEPTSVISYCNIAKFEGDVYTKIGFKLDSLTKPNYIWVNHKYQTLSRYKTQKSALIAKGLGDESETEDTIMKRQGYMKIYDCGNIKYVYNKE